ncbi:MAG: serine/threonine protein kinase, partial [Nannocystaceae bacterium]|nr:serine/threonine protein kinase [Nannocystaceae bacterium]
MASVSHSGDVVVLGRHRATLDESTDFGGDKPARPATRAEQQKQTQTQTIPSRIGRYIVLDTVGVGGMGVVCTAYDPKLDRKVALKLLKKARDKTRAQTSQARLVREAQALAKLSHPNIVTVHDVDTYRGQLYIAMEYVEGSSLETWVLAEPRTHVEIIDVFVRAGRGLAAAHAAGITHRDFKPGNVQVGADGRVRVLDFGLAKSADEVDASLDLDEAPATSAGIMDLVGSASDLKLTQVGRTVGTPSYMAPEQFYGQSVGPQTDQFAFGVSLFEALHGELPFGDPDDVGFVDRVCEAKPDDPPVGTHVPAFVTRVIVRMLQRAPNDRYASMDAALLALQSDPSRRRRRWIAGAGVAAVVGLSGYGALQLLGSRTALCSGAEDKLREVWNERARIRVSAAFAAT